MSVVFETCLGVGSSGAVISPAIPNGQPVNPNTVSKILYSVIHDTCGNVTHEPSDSNTFEYEYDNIGYLVSRYPNIFTSNNFILPIDGGMIDIFPSEIKIVPLSSCPYAIHTAQRCSNILNQMLKTGNPLYHIVFPKGTPINMDIFDFVSKIKNIFDCLGTCNKSNIFLDDITYNNLVCDGSNIKIIDFANPLIICPYSSLCILKHKLNNVMFKNIHYYSYNPILGQLVYRLLENLDSVFDNYNVDLNDQNGTCVMNDISKMADINIYTLTQEYDQDNVNYKKKLIVHLFEIIKYCNPLYEVKIKLKKFDK